MTSNVSTLREHNALVTGASGGIGRAIVTALAAAGASLFLVGRSRERLDRVARELRAPSPRVQLCPTDLISPDEIDRLGTSLTGTLDRLDILVHCAGAIEHSTLEEAPLTAMDLLYEANIRGPLYLTQRLLPLLRGGRGQIVFINSSAGLHTRPGSGLFSATQHALRALADTLRQEINSDGIRVLSVFPGRTATERVEAIFSNEGKPYEPALLLQPQDIAEVVVSCLLLPRTAEVTDIAVRPLAKSY